MEKVRMSGRKRLGILIAVLCMSAAIVASIFVSRHDDAYPTSDSGALDAELIHVASVVGGRLIELRVHENQHVRKGDFLYQIDPEPYKLTVQQAEANVALMKADLANQKRFLAVRVAQAETAKGQVARAESNRDLANRTITRLAPLANQSYIPKQQYDQARVLGNDADISLTQAREQAKAADTAIGDVAGAEAALAASEATLARVKYELRQTRVVAPADGYVTSLRVQSGEVLIPSQVLFTLVLDDEWYAIANLRETNLSSIKIGDCATVYSMIDRSTPIPGTVSSIGWGVLSGDSLGVGRSLPFVPRQMDWVHVAQRFPVRVHLKAPQPLLMRMGATAVVEFRHGAACD
jgi:multidrug efflux system membrane fusion protein